MRLQIEVNNYKYTYTMKLLYLLFLLLVAASELQIETLNHLECTSRTKNGDTVGIHYTGYLSDGTKFDSSHDRNVPLYFEIGRGQMIQGWEKGVLDMCPGEKRKLLIPPELGYGERGIGPIPPNSDLTFDIELVEVLNLRDEL